MSVLATCYPSFYPGKRRATRHWRRIFRGMFLSAFLFSAAVLCAQQRANSSSGIAWDVRGVWQVDGTDEVLHTGDAVAPGSLLRPKLSSSEPSITVLLLDGQQISYECLTAKGCARGFRVPALSSATEQFAVEMVARIRAALAQQRGRTAVTQGGETRIARDEAVAELGPGNRIEIGGLAAALSNGKYFGDLRSLNAGYPEQSGIPLEKSGHSIALTVPGPGLFVLRIIDSMKWPRIEFTIAVVPAQNSSVFKDFKEAHDLMMEWREESFGWPMHDFQRAYLQSLMLGIAPAPGSGRMAGTGPRRPEVTADPAFTPKPGAVEGDISVTLQCATPGAVIHYTIDNSQPLDNSPTYRAPILMKTVPLRIKAFAESPGKKDSPVVTGNFWIEK